ncbi:IS5 family transposase [Streptomyces sp. NPDC052164]|uniref:IS5 family transposase n=1 Tax=Streptomyces sp. NPDC052164 TaxID=3155529 RepID=UPI00342932A2
MGAGGSAAAAAPERRRRHHGRLRVPDRVALAGVLYVLRTGVAWRDVPAETVGCSGATAWRRLRDLTEAGVWPRARTPRCWLSCAAPACWTWTTAPWTGRASGPSKGGSCRPLARRPCPSRLEAPSDRRPSRTPLAVTLTGGNRHDVTRLLPLLDAVPPIRGLRGRPRLKPRRLYADRGYDFDKYRRLLWKRGIKPMTARRGVAHGPGLGKVRWVVERAFAWLHQSKRLRTRYERRADLHQR